MRPTLTVSLVFASVTGLLACPQLLTDDFDSSLLTGDDRCARRLPCAGAGGSNAAGGAAGSAGSPAGTGGSTPGAGGSGSAATAGSGGAGGSGGSGSGGAGGSGGASGRGGGGSGGAGSGGAGGSDASDASVDPPDPEPSLACWFVPLDDDTHVASDNCVDIHGWNQIVMDLETPSPPAARTVVDLTYEAGAACFTGTIVNQGWGAVFNLTLNDGDPWDASGRGVGGFQFEATGARLPPEMQVKYSDDDDGDFCRVFTPGAAVPVPFASAHPDCSAGSNRVTDAVDLTFIRLVIPPAASDYPIDFCLGVRAIP